MSGPQTYKVERVLGGRPWTPAGESAPKMTFWDLEVEGVGKCSLGLPPNDPEPQVGQEIVAVLTPGKNGYPPKLALPKKGGGGGSSRNSPQDLRLRAAQGALSNAVTFAPDGARSEDVLKVADLFYGWLREKTGE